VPARVLGYRGPVHPGPPAAPAVGPTARLRTQSTALVLAGAAGLAVALGVLTAYAQGWLPEETNSLANSVGTWVLVAFILALVPATPTGAVACGVVTLLGLLAGYVIGAALRDFTSSTSLIIFWGLAAALAGPLVGLSASWVRSGRPARVAAGAGTMVGVLVGEGVYGLSFIADTTSPPYWWAEIVIGVAVFGALSVSCRLRLRWVAVAALVAAAVGSTFVVVYSQDLISLL